MFYEKDCLLCGRCVALCLEHCHRIEEGRHLLNRENCIRCFSCIRVACGALEKAGRRITADEVIRKVVEDEVFYKKSGGGITLSGGEPLFQPEFSLELLRRAKAHGLHTVVETCGYASGESVEKIAGYTDLFLWDCKETDLVRHRCYTGKDNRLILDNLERLGRKRKKVILRCPVIPGYNDREDHFFAIGKLVETYAHIEAVEVEPYHALGEGKRAALGKKRLPIPEPSPEDVERWIQTIRQGTDTPVRRS